ncbi:MAG: hypothetical protein LJE95_00465 [Acidobacteria bacterium]|jgi:hypothetical protein|nr:hypothetical protein [Acidobacteriota bacterium]
MRSCFVFRLGVLVLGGCAVLSVACGGGKTGSGPAVATAGEAGAHSAGGTISRASVEGCGGFTVDKAAGILGVEPSRLVDKAAWASWSDQERECLFQDSENIAGPAVWFNLTMEKSVGDAASAMAQLREHVAVGGKAIDAVTGSKTPEYADSQFVGIGDEAFWVGSTDALAMRRGNVTAMVGVRGVDGTVEKTKVVARELAAALH